MSRIIPRTCTEVRATNTPADAGASQPAPLERFRDAPAYVLLGDPGAGKTTAFKHECAALGDAAAYVTARDFLTFEPEDRPEWRGKTLFIDGLDERRAGAPDKSTPFDRIRRRLAKLGNPRFRLSCRAADWLGENDRQHLEAVTPQRSAVTVLQLDPLTEADANALLTALLDVPDPKEFINSARARSLDGLLGNPQSLALLATVVAKNGTWPQSRLQTFEQACRHLATEQNDEHRHSGPPPEVDATLDAAGRLCAMLLITGGTGFAADPYNTDNGYLDPEQCAYAQYDRNALLQALGTKLFTAEAERKFIPVHRHLAEYLAARHIDGLISNGLPGARVVALIIGEDDGLVSEHRGLAAWLAAHCKEVRRDLIERDPIGVVSYGDVHDFPTDEKRALLSALKRDGKRLWEEPLGAAALGALVTPDMAPVLREALGPLDELPFTAFVLNALTHGTPLPELAEFLFELVYKSHRWRQLPRIALEAFLHNSRDASGDQPLLQILDDLRNGRLSDWNSELLGTALIELYPRRLPASEIWDYLLITNAQIPFGPSDYFWTSDLIEKSSESDIICLLDALAIRINDLIPALNRGLEDLPIYLLAHAIERYGDTLNAKQICKWLGVIIPHVPEPATDAVRRIGSWLERRPDTLKEVIAETAHRWADPQPDVRYQVDQIRCGAKFPPDYGLWCLQQAVTSSSRPWIKYYLYQSCDALARQTHDRGLTLEVLFDSTMDVPDVKQILTQDMLVCSLVRETPKLNQLLRRVRDYRERNHRELISCVRSDVVALHAGLGNPSVLHRLAEVYYGVPTTTRGDSPEERLINLFRGDTKLVEAALFGIRGVPSRGDLPRIDEIIKMVSSRRQFKLSLPFLAALELEPRHDIGHQARHALAFYYSIHRTHRARRGSPKWYRILLAHDPSTVADVLVKCVASGLRNGMQDKSLVSPLLIDEEHADVARRAVITLLDRFPLRCTIPQIKILDCLLHTALRYVARSRFRELIEKRLSYTSMTVATRIRWLTMGMIVATDPYLVRLQDFVRRREKRIGHLVEFLVHAGQSSSMGQSSSIGKKITLLTGTFATPKTHLDGLQELVQQGRSNDLIDFFTSAGPVMDEFTVGALHYLIGLLGSTVGRWDAGDSDRHSVSGSASSFVYKMIQRLAILPDMEAGAALDALASDAALDSWRDTLTSARDRQRVIRRDAGYQHPSFAQVRSTLRNVPPANAGDLAALLTDRLDEMAVRISTGNTDDWRQYWNVDQYEHAIEPKPENSCRDALLSDLRQILPKGVDAQPEGAYANDRRSDIRVTYRDFHVPVEAKRSNHRDLWSAIRRQLIDQYVSDPATAGYGIYLVFWFGTPDTPRPPGGGAPPDSPDALREQLEATLTEDERRRISVRVIDVSAL